MDTGSLKKQKNLWLQNNGLIFDMRFLRNHYLEYYHWLSHKKAEICSFLLFAFVSKYAWACSVCFKRDPHSPVSKGLNMSILLLLGCIAAVLICFALFFYHLKKRSQLHTLQSQDTTTKNLRKL